MSQTLTAAAILVEVVLTCGCVVTAPNHSARPATCSNKHCPDLTPEHRRPVVRPRSRS